MKAMLKKFFTAQAQHHAEMAKAHQSSGADYEDDCSESNFHKAAAKSHLTAGEECVNCCNECAKADFGGDLSKADMDALDAIIPTRISAVAPEPGKNLRAVFRTGQKDFSGENRAQNAPFDFSKLHAIEE